MDGLSDFLNNLQFGSGISPAEVMAMGTDLISRAAAVGDLTPFKYMVDELADTKGCAEAVFNSRNKHGLSVVHMAAMGGSTNVIEYLLKKVRLDIDIKDWKAGHTALHLAILFRREATAIFLLEKGASPNAESQLKRTPLHFAVQYGTEKIILLLISKGADVNAVADCGTPLQFAVAKNKIDVVKVLLEKHANPNQMSHVLITPLIASIAARSNECMETLLKAGADPHLRGFKGRASLGWAASDEQDATDVIKCLISVGADPNVTDNLGTTPLEIAALEGCRQNFMYLFPLTCPIPNIPNWSIEGVMDHVQSDEASQKRNGKLKELLMLAIARGANSLKRRDYLDAALHYSEAICYDPTNVTLMSKESLCWARLNEGERAMHSAQSCLALRPQWYKAYLRIGEAWMVLKDFDKAASAFRDGLKLDRNNMELKSALREALEAKKNQPVMVFGPESSDAARRA